MSRGQPRAPHLLQQIARGLRAALGQGQQHQSGSAAVEFALIVPVLLAFIFGTIEIGRGIFAGHTVIRAVQVGARYAIVHGAASDVIASESQIADYIKSNTVGINQNKFTITVTYDPDNAPGSLVTVQGDYSHDLMYPFGFIGPITVSSKSEMTIFQ